MKKPRQASSSGFTLVELTVATALLAILSASSVVLVRTSYAAWQRHDGDNKQRQAAIAAVRHIARQVRQARAVFSISSDSLSIITQDGETWVWEYDAGSKEIRFGISTASNVLATEVEAFALLGYRTLVSPTTEPGLIHSVLINVTVNIDRPLGVTPETFRAWAHLRAW